MSNVSDQDNVFSNESISPTQAQQQTSQDAYKDLLASIKNEQGQQKYATLEDALKALQHSQEYIPQLKTQLTEKERQAVELQAKLEQAGQLEDVVSRLTAQNKTQAQEDKPLASGLSEEAVAKLVQQQLEQVRIQEQTASNTAQVQQALLARYGDKTKDVVAQKAAELGLTPQELGVLSSQKPQMVLALFNAQGSSGPKPTTSSVTIPSSYEPPKAELAPPSKSLLTGASTKEQMEYMRKVRESVYAKHNITPN